MNYVCWLSDFVSPQFARQKSHILDIGVGASCIYPLLGCKLFDWNFVGSDSDPDAISCAFHNIARNHLQDRISVVLVNDSLPLQTVVETLFAHNVKKNYDTSTCASAMEVEMTRSETLAVAHTGDTDAYTVGTGGGEEDTNDGLQEHEDNDCGQERSESHTKEMQDSLHALLGAGLPLSTLRGPVRSALAAISPEHASVVSAAEARCYDTTQMSDPLPCMMDACMCNPPFYDINETVRQ